VLNGDFEVSDYYYQAAHELFLMEKELSTIKNPDDAHEKRGLYMERFRRLSEDYEKDEADILRKMKRDFRKSFGITKEQLEQEMENFDGTIQELYSYIKEKYKK
jgi:ATPase subunit of ABC transporter with duplicated ATPase domains